MTLLDIENLYRSYPDGFTLKVDRLTLDEGGVLGLLGPSGCGKTTLLRLLAGLEEPDNGRILFDGRDMVGVPVHRRRFGFMFQDYALFPHMNVLDNVAFGLTTGRRPPSADRAARVEEILSLVGLTGLEKRDVADLSGGERQRVALARCLAPRPRLLLLDEPMGALDRLLRDRLVLDLKKILIRLGQTAVFVTHDQTEALALADQVAVFNQGRLRRSGTPAELYRAPGDPFVARFLGLGNLIPGRIQGMGAETGIGYFPLDAPPDQGSAVWVILRAEGARMLEPDQTPGPDEVVVEGRAGVALFLGRGWRLGLTPAEGPDLTFELPLDQPPPRPGEPVRLALRRGHVIHCPWTNGGDGP